MKAVLCVFGLVLTCKLHLAARIPVQPNFRYEEVEGVWHRVAMVLRGAEAEVVGADIEITPMTKGFLYIQKKIEIRHTCREISSRLRQTNRPGKFKSSYSFNSPSTVHFVATDYKSYLFLHIKTSHDTGLYLFARGSNVSPVIMKKFKHQSESLGFSKHSIRYSYTDTEARCTF